MEIAGIIPHIEALVFASDKPLTSLEITELINNAFGFMDDKIVLDQVESALEGIIEKYRSDFYPFEVRESGGGWQFLTKRDFHKTIAQLNGDKFLKRLSAAALETLAIIAYKQPITKSEIEAIRGVNCDYAVQRLLEKELVVITGRNEQMVGKPLIYATSKSFMDYFGLNTADDLPKIKEILADQFIEPTVVLGEGQSTPSAGTEGAGGGESLAVDTNGELISSQDGADAAVQDDTDTNSVVDEQQQIQAFELDSDSIEDGTSIEDNSTLRDSVEEEIEEDTTDNTIEDNSENDSSEDEEDASNV